jgi:transcriptional regulator with XRE-family HTH domain
MTSMNAEDPGPTVQRALLTQELKQLRAATGLTQEDVAADRGWSVSKFTRIENGTGPVSKNDLESLLRLAYHVDDQQRVEELLALAAAAQRRGWWLDYYSGPDKAFVSYLGYEDGASAIRAFQGVAVPGLLQTEDYIRADMAIFNRPQELIDRTVKLRRERQRRAAARALEQHYIVDEAVLRRPVGDVMPDQLRHLLQVAKDPAVDLRIIPLKAGPHFGLKGPFVLLGFGKLMSDVLYIEGVRRGDLLIAEPETDVPGGSDVQEPFNEIATYIDGFGELRKIALPPADSMDLIDEVIRDTE